jgi:UDP-2,4-diacetamido-2,4,6-trideoxy-beta-L-altropyranose hydrolase
MALAHAWRQKGGGVIFITSCENDRLRNRLLSGSFEVADLKQPYPDPMDEEITCKLLRGYPGAWVVLDGYHFDPVYQLLIKETAHRLLIIDDMAHQDYYHADVLLNQNIDSDRLNYFCDPETRLLLGVQYALLRPEFLKWSNYVRAYPKLARRILVTLGGGDPGNVTLKVVKAVQAIRSIEKEVKIVVGPANPNIAELLNAVSGVGHFELLTDVHDMSELMAWADVAVTAGGSTCWELCFMGLPALVLVLAQNQERIAQGLESHGAAVNMGWHASVDETDITKALKQIMDESERRQQMSERGRRLVDGCGANRVATILLETRR